MELFHAYSIMDNIGGRDEVRCDWYVDGRLEPVADYRQVIDNSPIFGALDETVTHRYVDSLLTRIEVDELASFLMKRYCKELRFEQVALPVATREAYRHVYGLIECSMGRPGHVLRLSHELGYPLSVSIVGSIDDWGFWEFIGRPSVGLSDEGRDLGMSYLQEALGKMGLRARSENGVLHLDRMFADEDTGICNLFQVAERLYDIFGLYVQQGEPKWRRAARREEELRREIERSELTEEQLEDEWIWEIESAR